MLHIPCAKTVVLLKPSTGKGTLNFISASAANFPGLYFNSSPVSHGELLYGGDLANLIPSTAARFFTVFVPLRLCRFKKRWHSIPWDAS